jgi:2-polyprenyl-3-methyl-5-hydroxy-6-metoxy-1,4-benzoquinol methylase
MNKIEKTIIAYNKNYESYKDKFMSFPLYEDKVKDFITFLPHKNKVLDLGCGPGNVLNVLCSSGKEFSVTGLDLSEKMIEVAKNNIPTGEFYCKDIRDINFSEDSFDVIILSFCIVHLEHSDVEALIKKISKYLENKGKIYLSFMEGKKSGFETTSFSKEEIYFNYYSADEIVNLLNKYGFKTFKISKQDYPETDGTFTTDVFIFAEKNIK